MASVAVIIPCYEHWQFVQDALASVRRQTVPVQQIIVVDDGSTSPPPGLGPDVELIRQDNAGVAVARNTALAHVTSDFVVPLDADNELCPTFVEQTTRAWRRSPRRSRLAVVYTPALIFGTETGVRKVGMFSRRNLAPYNTIDQCALIRTDALRDIGGWAPELTRFGGSEDWDLWLALAAAGWRGKMIPEPLYRYRNHEGPRANMQSVAADRVDAAVAIIDRRHPWRRQIPHQSKPARAVQKLREWHHDYRQRNI